MLRFGLNFVCVACWWLWFGVEELVLKIEMGGMLKVKKLFL